MDCRNPSGGHIRRDFILPISVVIPFAMITLQQTLSISIAITLADTNILKYYCPLNFKDSKNVWLER